jgi:hypothetical protein
MPSEDKLEFKLFYVTNTNSWDVPDKFCGLDGTHT